MKHVLLAAAMCVFSVFAAQALAAEQFLVKDGRAQAEIIIAENPPRTVRLAAHELQNYVEKISGARLPIATQPSDGVPVRVYVGRSPHTD
ncbi:MAG TPA: hypothetical protein VMM76_15705, partial [Pirellulaceae bacterium]|nr:hypothetical protein [Pirellulaceae bacterium]